MTLSACVLPVLSSLYILCCFLTITLKVALIYYLKYPFHLLHIQLLEILYFPTSENFLLNMFNNPYNWYMYKHIHVDGSICSLVSRHEHVAYMHILKHKFVYVHTRKRMYWKRNVVWPLCTSETHLWSCIVLISLNESSEIAAQTKIA